MSDPASLSFGPARPRNQTIDVPRKERYLVIAERDCLGDLAHGDLRCITSNAMRGRATTLINHRRRRSQFLRTKAKTDRKAVKSKQMQNEKSWGFSYPSTEFIPGIGKQNRHEESGTDLST